MSDNEKQFTLRIDADIFEKLKQVADLDKRSIAKEIEFIVEQYVKTHLKDM